MDPLFAWLLIIFTTATIISSLSFAFVTIKLPGQKPLLEILGSLTITLFIATSIISLLTFIV